MPKKMRVKRITVPATAMGQPASEPPVEVAIVRPWLKGKIAPALIRAAVRKVRAERLAAAARG